MAPNPNRAVHFGLFVTQQTIFSFPDTFNVPHVQANLIITLLAEGPDQHLEIAREMAKYISPRAGFTQHPLTVKASDRMTDMVNRAEHYRTVKTT